MRCPPLRMEMRLAIVLSVDKWEAVSIVSGSSLLTGSGLVLTFIVRIYKQGFDRLPVRYGYTEGSSSRG